MKNSLLLIAVLCIANIISAQNKNITIYHTGGSKTVVDIASTDSLVIFICGSSKVNYGSKAYNTVLIGSQCWLKENLEIGTMITGYPSNNGVIEKYCYNNDPNNCTTYGGLYFWDEAMQYVTTEGAKGICPTGWHMPTLAEYQDLVTTVSSEANALKEIGQGTGAGAGTNTSGFSALLAGGKGYSGGPFQALGDWGSFYVGKVGACSGYACVYLMQVLSGTNTVTLGEGTMPSWGMSVRCIKD
jgi:uncharacterized protein (TIGR02145 family)